MKTNILPTPALNNNGSRQDPQGSVNLDTEREEKCNS